MLVWCDTHQLDLVMGKILSIVVEDQFYSVMNVFTSYLGWQAKLIAYMDTIFPCVVNRWLLTSKVMKWFKLNRM